MTNQSNLINKKGFTLIELIITIAIVSILSLIAFISINQYVATAKEVADKTNLRTLNNITSYYRITIENSDPFIDNSNSSNDLMEVLVENGQLTSPILTLTADTNFLWNFDTQAWYLIKSNAFYTISISDGLSFFNNNNGLGRLNGPFTGDMKDVILPSELDGIQIKEIYQKVFLNKGLTSFVFGAPSVVTQIHLKAFEGNELSSIVFPDTLKRIDYQSFKDNNLTEITLPEGLTKVESKAFEGNNITKITVGSQLSTIGTTAFGINNAGFAAAYQAGGAGTYVYINNVWVKQ